MPFDLKTRYNFNTLAPALLGSSFKNMTVVSIMDYTVASKYFSPDAQAVSVYPSLPNGTPSDPKNYTYVLFKPETGDNFVLALEWIDVSSIQLVTSSTVTVTINNTVTGDTQRIRDSLILLGFTNFTIAVN